MCVAVGRAISADNVGQLAKRAVPVPLACCDMMVSLGRLLTITRGRWSAVRRQVLRLRQTQQVERTLQLG